MSFCLSSFSFTLFLCELGRSYLSSVCEASQSSLDSRTVLSPQDVRTTAQSCTVLYRYNGEGKGQLQRFQARSCKLVRDKILGFFIFKNCSLNQGMLRKNPKLTFSIRLNELMSILKNNPLLYIRYLLPVLNLEKLALNCIRYPASFFPPFVPSYV